jgi:hypothetical protein
LNTVREILGIGVGNIDPIDNETKEIVFCFVGRIYLEKLIA